MTKYIFKTRFLDHIQQSEVQTWVLQNDSRAELEGVYQDGPGTPVLSGLLPLHHTLTHAGPWGVQVHQ